MVTGIVATVAYAYLSMGCILVNSYRSARDYRGSTAAALPFPAAAILSAAWLISILAIASGTCGAGLVNNRSLSSDSLDHSAMKGTMP
jgi:hypothetical protein